MSRKNVWRRIGRLEFRRESGRYSDGTLDGRDVLWVRSIARDPVNRGKAVAYCDTGHDGRGARLGLGIYPAGNGRHDAVSVAKRMGAHLRRDMAERGI